MAKGKKSKKIAMFVAGALGVMVIGGVAIGVANNKDTKDVGGVFAYEIGTLDTNGEKTKGDTSAIRSKDFNSVKGLSVELAKDATVTYELFFYDKDYAFLESLKQTDDYDKSELPSGAETSAYYKIVITPTNDAEVSWTEISKYEKQVTVTIDK